MAAEQRFIEITSFSGLELDGSPLTRSPESFRRLENFDLVLGGTIRKVNGIVDTGFAVSGVVITAMRDYRRKPDEPIVLIGYSSSGGLYRIDTSEALAFPFGEPGHIPYMVSLPNTINGEDVYTLYITRGSGLRPKKMIYNAAIPSVDIRDVGVINPVEDFGADRYKHSLAAIAVYTDDPTKGVPIVVGRRYRWTWYNPETGDESSPVPVHDGEISSPHNRTRIKGPGTVVAPEGKYIAQITLHFNAADFGDPIPGPSYGTGFTHVRIYASLDGTTDYRLCRRLYDNDYNLITDQNGAIPLSVLRGAPRLFDPSSPLTVPSFAIFDGITSFPDDGYTVSGGGQTGNTLLINRPPGAFRPLAIDEIVTIGTNYGTTEELPFVSSFFTIAHDLSVQDDTLYMVTNAVLLPGSMVQLTIDPPLATSPPNGAQIMWRRILPISDAELVDLGPEDNDNDPPPPAVWGTVYQNRLWLLDGRDTTKLYYSRAGQYDKFPRDNFVQLMSDDLEPITALITGRQIGLVSEGRDARLVVGKRGSISQIQGALLTDTDLEKNTLFGSTGILGRRLVSVINGVMIALTQRGLEVIDEQRLVWLSRKVKSIIDGISNPDMLTGPQLTGALRDGVLLLAYNDEPDPADNYNTKILMLSNILDLEKPGFSLLLSGFTGVDGRPIRIASMYESNINNRRSVFISATDGHVYELFKGTSAGSQPVVAVAETQLLPQEEKDKWKVFIELRMEEVTSFEGWSVSYITNAGLTVGPFPLRDRNFIGLTCKSLSVRFTNNEAVEPAPTLGNFRLYYNIIGESV